MREQLAWMARGQCNYVAFHAVAMQLGQCVCVLQLLWAVPEAHITLVAFNQNGINSFENYQRKNNRRGKNRTVTINLLRALSINYQPKCMTGIALLIIHVNSLFAFTWSPNAWGLRNQNVINSFSWIFNRINSMQSDGAKERCSQAPGSPTEARIVGTAATHLCAQAPTKSKQKSNESDKNLGFVFFFRRFFLFKTFFLIDI